MAEQLIQKNHYNVIKLIMKMIQARDHFTEEHCKRVCKIASLIVNKLKIDYEEITKIELAALIHDVGKISVSDTILLKPGKLTMEEYQEVKNHSFKGYQIINDNVNRDVAELVLYHHEQFSGRGYPCGLRGEKIPLGARIIALADQYDALRNNRPYRKALTVGEAIKVMKEDACKFDPRLLEVFLAHIMEVESNIFPTN